VREWSNFQVKHRTKERPARANGNHADLELSRPLEQFLEYFTEISELVSRMTPPFDVDLANYADFEKVFHHISNVVGTHTELRILKECLPFDCRSLHGAVDRLDDRGTMAIAHRTEEIPRDVWKTVS